MKCPECGSSNAQQLLVSFLCPNKTCINYDTRQAEAAWRKSIREQEKTRQEQSLMQMELAIAQVRNSNEQKMLQDQAQMELEKIRHMKTFQGRAPNPAFRLAALSKLAQELAENKPEEDPLDAAMKEYLQRKLQIGWIKDLSMDD